jgi:hypothetical protein
VHFFIISPLSFRAENNLDQWYQSRLFLIVFFSACPRRGPSIESWVSSLSLLKTIALAHPRNPQWWKKRKTTEQTILSSLLLEQALTRQRDEMMENFSHILQHLLIASGTSSSSATLEAPHLLRYRSILIFLYLKVR